MRHSLFFAFAVAVVSGCGGEEATTPPPVAPPPAPVASAAPPASAAPTVSASAAPPPAPKLSMAEMQKKWRADARAAWDAKDAKKVAALYAEDAEVTGSGPEGMKTLKGRAEIEAMRIKSFAMMGKMFPDMKWFDYRALQKGDVLVVEWGTNATDTGGMMDAPPSNKKVGFRGVMILWFDENGLVKREHNYVDMMTARRQTTAGPKDKFRAPPEPPAGDTTWVTATDSDTEKKNLALATSAYAFFEKKDEKGFLALLDDNYVHSDQLAPEDAKGKAAAKKEFATFTKAFPDLKFAVPNSFAFGDVVVVETEMTGTFKGALGPMKPTNKTGTVHGVDVIEIKDGKATKVVTYGSAMEMVKAFEIPMPGKPGDKKPDAKPADKKPDAKPADKGAPPKK